MGYVQKKDLTGFKKGFLTVLSFAYYNQKIGNCCRASYWNCKCVCGKKIIVQRIKLVKGNENLSCGCWKADNISSNYKNSFEEIKQNKIDFIFNLSHWENSCLIWEGYSAKDRYPTTKFLNKNWLLKRLLWFLEYRNLPKGKVIYNTCENIKCINIKHLKMEKPRGNRYKKKQ